MDDGRVQVRRKCSDHNHMFVTMQVGLEAHRRSGFAMIDDDDSRRCAFRDQDMELDCRPKSERQEALFRVASGRIVIGVTHRQPATIQ
jgi:hypothetical protein